MHCFIFFAVLTVASAAPFIVPSHRHEEPATSRISASNEALAIASTEFALVAASESGCAATIYHGQVHDIEEGESLDIEGLIKFEDIKVNGEPCVTGEEEEATKLFDYHVIDATLPGGNVLNLSAVAARSVTITGADTAARECGSWKEEYEQSYFFSQDIQRMLPSLSNSGFIGLSSIPEEELFEAGMWMVSAPKDSSGRICLYRQVPETQEEEDDVVPTMTPDVEETETIVETSESEDDSSAADESSTETLETTTSSGSEPQDTSDEEETEEPESSGIFGDANQEAIELEQQEGEEDASCFPGSAQVRLEDGTIKQMRELQIGNRVMVAPNVFSEVFMFTHKLDDADYKFIRIQTDLGRSLSATAGHFIYINGKSASAQTASVGDFVELADGSKTAITSISTVRERGLYNPQTAHGDIMVNEIRASTYTSAVSPSVAHALLAPLRVLYSRFSIYTSSFDRGAGSFAYLISKRP